MAGRGALRAFKSSQTLIQSGALAAALAAALLANGCASPYRAPGVEPERATARAPAVKPAPPPEEQRPETYTVKRGDTLYSIALDNGLDYRDLAAWNNVVDPAVIGTGQVLRMRPPAVPAQPEAEVQVQPVTVPGAVEARPLGADPRAGAADRGRSPQDRAQGDEAAVFGGKPSAAAAGAAQT